MEDLERADIKTDDSGETTMAKPRVSRQFEIGVRKNWGDFVTTLNAFQIKRPGYWRGNTKKVLILQHIKQQEAQLTTSKVWNAIAVLSSMPMPTC